MITGNQAKSQEKLLVTGLADMELLVANPTKDQLSQILNTDIESITPYSGVENGVAFNNLRIYLKGELEGEEFIVPITFWLKDEFRQESRSLVDKDDPNSGNKVLLTNNYGVSRYGGPNGEGMGDWFTSPGFRRTKLGEDTLYNFLTAWLNINTKEEGAEVKLDNYDALLKGDASELNSYIEQFNDRKVRCLIGIKDGKYMHIFTRGFLSEGKIPKDNFNPTKLSWFTQQVKAVNADGSPSSYGLPWKYDFQNSYALQKYAPTAAEDLSVIDGEQAPSDAMASPSSSNSPFA